MNLLQDIVFYLFLFCCAYSAITFFRRSNNYKSFKNTFFIGVGAAIVFGLLSAVMGLNRRWTLASREKTPVEFMSKTDGFQFKYLTLHDRRIPLIEATDESTKALLADWHVLFFDGAVNKNVNDTLYCYLFEEIMFGTSTGDEKVAVYPAPIPAYEFALFYEKEERVDTSGAFIGEKEHEIQ